MPINTNLAETIQRKSSLSLVIIGLDDQYFELTLSRKRRYVIYTYKLNC